MRTFALEQGGSAAAVSFREVFRKHVVRLDKSDTNDLMTDLSADGDAVEGGNGERSWSGDELKSPPCVCNGDFVSITAMVRWVVVNDSRH